jgi:hypothetical protein
MSELNGLRVIVSEAVAGRTLHAIDPPPERDAYPDNASYRRAYDEWWRHMNCWTVTNIGV